MARIRHIRTEFVQPDLPVDDVGPGFSDLLSGGTGAAAQLYGVRPDEMGLEVRDFGGALAVQDRAVVAQSGGLDAPRRLAMAQIDGADVLLSAGRYGRDIEAYRLDAEGEVAGRFALKMTGGGPGALTALAVTDDAELFVTASRQAAGLTVWQRDGNTLTQTSVSRAGDLSLANDIFDLSLVENGAGTRLLAVSSSGDSLLNFALSGTGRLRDLEILGSEQGLFMDKPDHLITTQVAGQTYALVGASGTSSLAVVALGPDGGMVLRDHVGDDLNTRFQRLSVLEAVTVQGQTYVVAGGADDGLSLMTLLPGGRLLHVDTLAFDVGMALDNPGGLALMAGPRGIDIVASGNTVSGQWGSGQAGLSHFEVTLGNIGVTRILGSGADRFTGGGGRDQIAGGGGNDTLFGGGGDDVLMDGAGSDQMYGGAGADVFVLVRDGQSDRIRDFEIGVDRLDLSQIGQFYTAAAVQIVSTNKGARIDLGGERLWIETADGAPLDAEDFATDDLRDLWHMSIEAPPEPQRAQPTSTPPPPPPEPAASPSPHISAPQPTPPPSGPAHVPGSPPPVPGSTPDASRILTGGADRDRLTGGTGNDRLIGERGEAALDAIAGQVFRLYSATLDRAPDLVGLQNWVDRLSSGEQTLTEVAGRFVNSAEFGRTYGNLDNGSFITLLYENVLDRAPDAGGFAHWTGLLDGGARSSASVVEGFSQSREFVAKTAVDALAYGQVRLQAEYSDEVFRLYGATLDRAPDPGGFRDWTGRLVQGMEYGDAIAGFTNSREFIRNYGDTDDKAFVRLLYNNVLDRVPDAGGQAHWLRKLDVEGWSREEVVEAFAQSREFVAKTAPEMIAWARKFGPDDVLEAGGGNDLLMGGILSDRFIFSTNADGRAVILDYEPWDQLVFEGFDYETSAEAFDYMRQNGNDVVFADQGVEVVLVDTSLGDVFF